MSGARPVPEAGRPYRRKRLLGPRRRRPLWWRLAGPLASAVLVVATAGGSLYWLATTPLLRVSRLAVTGGERVSLAWAHERLARLEGRHILTVDLAEFEAALAGHPWLRGVEIAKRLPSHVEVRLLEKQPVAILRAGDSLYYLDRWGEPIAPYDPLLGGSDFVVVTVDPPSGEVIREALAVADLWRRKGLQWAGGLSEIVAVDASSFRLVVADLGFPLLVDRTSLDRLESFARVLPEINRRFPAMRMADLRFSGQIVFQPAVAPPTEG